MVADNPQLTIPKRTEDNKKTIRNGIIQLFKIGYDDKGTLTSLIRINYGELSQGYGTMDLSKDNRMAIWLTGLFSTFNVADWDGLKNMPCRVEADDTKIYRIGHFIENKWFSMADSTVEMLKDAVKSKV